MGGGGGGEGRLFTSLPAGLNRALIYVTNLIGHAMYASCSQVDNEIGQYALFARHFVRGREGGAEYQERSNMDNVSEAYWRTVCS